MGSVPAGQLDRIVKLAKPRAAGKGTPAPRQRTQPEPGRKNGLRSPLDVAAAVDLGRSSPRIALPHAEVMRALFGPRAAGLGRLEVHRGPAARRAAEMLGARAFSVRNVIVFAEENPAASRVAHEVAHALQQGGDRDPAPVRFAPGSLTIGAPASAAECEAHAAAHGAPPPSLSHAPTAVYRDTGHDLADTERRLLEMMKQPAYKPIDHVTAENARFAAKAGTKEAKLIYRYSSPRPWRRGDLWKAARDAGDAEATVEQASKDVENIFAGVPRPSPQLNLFPPDSTAIATKGLDSDDGIKYRISKIDTGATVLSLYAFIGDSFAGANPAYLETVVDLKRDDYEKTDPAVKLAEYKAILDNIVKTAEGKNKDKSLVDAVKQVVTDIDTWLADKALSTADLDQKTQDARHAFIPAILKLYPNLDELHENIIKTKVFTAKYTSIQGAIFETWYKDKFGKEYDLVDKPVFGEKIDDDKLIKSDKLKKLRKGDFAVEIKGAWRIRELKAVNEPPGEEHRAQMDDYAVIITEPIPGYFYKDNKLTSANMTAVDYVFSDQATIETAKLWKPDLDTHLIIKGKKLYTSTPDPDAQPDVDVNVKTEHSPTLTFHIANADTKKHHFDATALDTPQTKRPGLTLISADIELLYERDPRVKSGKLEMNVDMGGQLKKEKDEKPLTPAPETEAEVAAAPKKAKKAPPPPARPHAIIGNDVGGMTSTLDKLLSRVRTDGYITDEGLTGVLIITPGASGIPGFLIAQGTEISATLAADRFSMRGNVALKHETKDIVGGIEVKWDTKSKNLTVTGSLTARKLIPVVDELKLKVVYTTDPENLVITVEDLKLSKQLKGVLLEGEAKNLTYDAAEAAVSADSVTLSATLAAIGKVSATAKIEKNEITEATFEYKSSELVYPRKSKTPFFKGTVDGKLTYSKGTFSGEIAGTASIRATVLKKLSPKAEELVLTAKVSVAEDGTVSGYIRSATPIQLGKYFELSAIQADLDQNGDVSTTFTVKLVNLELKKIVLSNAVITCTIDKDGFRVGDVSIGLDFGTPEADRAWGVLYFSYKRGAGFLVGGEVDVMIKKGLVATGKFTYDVEKDVASASLETGKIPLLNFKPDKPKKLFGIGPKQFMLFYIYVGGMYFEIGFELLFDYSLEFWVKPKISLDELNLKTFDYERAIARMTLGGALTATLTASPQVGIGLFLLHTALLRGGGGIKIPVKAKAELLPEGIFEVTYSKEGGVEGGARLGLVMTFGITADITPYANFVVLSGLYEAEWNGESFKTFEILPRRELFTYVVDFGKPLHEETDPELPTGSKAPATPSVTRKLQEKQPGGDEKVGDKKDDSAQTEARKDVSASQPGSSEEGFDLKGMVAGILDKPKIKAIRALIDEAVEFFKNMFGWIGKVVTLVKNWVGEAIEAIKSFMKGVREAGGLFAYLKIWLKGKVSETVFYVIEPLLDMFEKQEKKFLELIGRPLPSSFTGWLEWTVDSIKLILDLSFGGLLDFVDALATMIDRIGGVVGRLINAYVQQGDVNARRGLYGAPLTSRFDEWIPNAFRVDFGGFELSASGRPSIPLATPLWLALNNMDHVAYVRGEPQYDFWVERKERPSGQMSPFAEEVLFEASRTSYGIPLPDLLQGKFEESLLTDLDQVRVHTDSAAAMAADALNARAFAMGRDIYFGAGEYAPATEPGERLLAHEVAHAVMPPADRPAPGQSPIRPPAMSSASEIEAEVMAGHLVEKLTTAPPEAEGERSKQTQEQDGPEADSQRRTQEKQARGPESRTNEQEPVKEPEPKQEPKRVPIVVEYRAPRETPLVPTLRRLEAELACAPVRLHPITALLGMLSRAERIELLADRGGVWSGRLRVLPPAKLASLLLPWREDLESRLRFLAAHAGGRLAYDDVMPMLLAATSEEKRRLDTPEWRTLLPRRPITDAAFRAAR